MGLGRWCKGTQVEGDVTARKGEENGGSHRRLPMRDVNLTPKERQIVDLLLAGAENKDIAKELGIAYRTVKSHFNRMYLKHGITSGAKRVKLAVMAYRESASSGGHSLASDECST